MELKPGYKLTEVGVIPADWEVRPLSRVAEIRGGIAKNSNAAASEPISVHYLRVANVQDGFLDLAEMSKIQLSRHDLIRYRVLPGDVLMNEGGDLDKLGRGAIWRGEVDPCVHQNHVFVVRCKAALLPEYLNIWTETSPARHFFLLTGKQTTNLASISKSSLGELPVAFPPLTEQRAIAAALSEVDALLGALERLRAKKRALKQAAMQQLLTGQTRLPGFSGTWEVKRIADIASPSSERNMTGEKLPVLTCSKHFGFMDSLGFFKNQVFSQDLSTYKVIRRDEIGYPANHVEEGSIGLQNLYDVALVSPIYVVFKVDADVSSFFLHRLLKLDSYRQQFKTATTSSVDRRGSLRWPAFSEITVQLPPTQAESTAIAAVLADMDAELTALAQRHAKTRALKQAMMQELLTGKTRLGERGEGRVKSEK
jgi:type I restriction enzyme S subunit